MDTSSNVNANAKESFELDMRKVSKEIVSATIVVVMFAITGAVHGLGVRSGAAAEFSTVNSISTVDDR